MNIGIIGTGYVGLVAGACFAADGHQVMCVDVDAEKIARLNAGIMPIYEAGLENLVKRQQQEGRLFFSTSLEMTIAHGLYICIAVGTPAGEAGQADIEQVLDAAGRIGDLMNEYKAVVIKSTVPVGTARRVQTLIADRLRHRGGAADNIEFDVISNPEFLREGQAITDFSYPDRIIVGVETTRAANYITMLYEHWIASGHRFILMDNASSELTKYAANAMLATRISFMNELAKVSEVFGADIDKVREGIGADCRIGPHFLHAGVGYGGSCFPKDIKALISSAEQKGVLLKILQAVETVNAEQKRYLVDKLIDVFGRNLSDRVFCIWGLSFKPGTDDMREAPSIALIQELIRHGALVNAHDPIALAKAGNVLKSEKVHFCADQYQAAISADALLLMTEWDEYKNPDLQRLAVIMRKKIILDGRNVYDAEQICHGGFQYFGIGRRCCFVS